MDGLKKRLTRCFMTTNICKHYKPTPVQKPTSKLQPCVYYVKYGNKIGGCNMPMKLAFLCHYSEVLLNIYTDDGVIVKKEEL